jgi:hypothetical protein
MGSASSAPRGGAPASAPAAALPPTASPPARERPAFAVATTSSHEGLPSRAPVTLRLDNEALVVLDDATGTQIYQCFYYRILCWGYSPASFYWRAFGEQASMEDEAAAQSFTVATAEGVAIERCVMGAVRALMGRMEVKGVDAKEFPGMLQCLTGLADDGLTDSALAAVKQMALGRAFDARQATALLNALGAMSPFDKVEAACALYPDSLLHPSTFAVILRDSFDDAGDRDNICHRLGLRITDDGSIERQETVASKTIKK